MNDQQDSPSMDSFTKKYLFFLASLALVALVWWLSSLDFRAGEINDLLAADNEIASYPYPFRVISVNKGVAKVSSPRSAELSALQSLRVMYPKLEKSDATSDEVMAAQKQLAHVQSKVAKLIKDQDDVVRISWVLDIQWLSERGIQIFQ